MSVEKYFKQNLAAMDENLKRDLDDNETLHANKAKVIKENYGLEIDSKNQAYDEDLRANEVQKYINMREVAENNANLGLTDSGLNRTQSTAVRLSASNNAAKIERDRNNMVRSLETEMNRYLTEIENSRISSAASIKKGYEDSAMSSAVDMYKADVDAAEPLNENNTEAIEISDNIRGKCASFESNTALAAYLDGLEKSGKISEIQSDQLFAEYMDSNEIYIEDENGNTTVSYKEMVKSANGWTVENDGGANLFGIDKDAKVKAPNGERITLKNLREKLKSEGMTQSEANQVLKTLQQNLGISSNWILGW